MKRALDTPGDLDITRTRSGTGESPLSPIEFLARAVANWPRRTAVATDQGDRTYAELGDRVSRIVGLLHGLDAQPQDRVVVILENSPEMIELHFGVIAAECVIVPLNSRLTQDEYTYILGHCEPLLVVSAASLVDTVSAALQASSSKAKVLVVDDEEPISSYEQGIRDADPHVLTVPEELSMLSINYTSGTTGRPKGVIYTHRGAYLQSLGVIAETGLTSTAGYLWTLPMFHCHGWSFIWAVTAVGATHYCCGPFEPGRVWKLLTQKSISHLCCAPTVLTMLLSHNDARPVGRQVSVFVGGAPPTPSLLARAEDVGVQVTQMYGLTETYGPVAVCHVRPDWDDFSDEEVFRLRARQGVGTAATLPIRVVDVDGGHVPADGQTIGEVIVSGNTVTSGYFRDGAATAGAIVNGWFHSGDLAVMHEDGYIELRDRAKDLIITGGENVSTIEVEQALTAHPDVVEAAALGVPDDLWGEMVIAVVRTVEGSGETESSLREFARKRLAPFKVPKRIIFRGVLPTTATGKIRKFDLRAEFHNESPMLPGR
ncbi:AMP-binding protein [Mycolicibacterium sp. YH-1]|uniref:AMP-binding protein n=1 Tax=Mycolicibacterium sp. YH-1 TaxID=2908837 RepID=UPI001F4C1BB3|nr:AMP-binding protein [Mycolicibacterium sp. YH-1]UNB52931.1 AMP-binding protein [Mycolicibacterium sp. YH-1]